MSNFQRCRTPSTIKWLLTERSALSGSLSKLKFKAALIEKRLRTVEPSYLKLITALNAADAAFVQKQAAIEAIDKALALVSPEVDPLAGGFLVPRENRFGEEGKMKKFLIRTLQSSGATPMTSTELTDLAIEQFNLTVYMHEVRRSVRRNITVALRRLQRSGHVEALLGEVPAFSGIWRWKQSSSLADLVAKAQRMAQVTAEVLMPATNLPTNQALQNEPTPARTRTPPDVKWLLNERAALAGAVSKAVARQQALCAKRERLEAQLEGALKLLERSRTAQSRAQASIDAIDVTLGLAHPCVRPTYAGEVSAWAGKYGLRGGLGEFIEQALQATAPAPVTATVLINLASTQFGVTIPLPKARRAFRKSVSSALTSLLKRGLIEPCTAVRRAHMVCGVGRCRQPPWTDCVRGLRGWRGRWKHRHGALDDAYANPNNAQQAG